MKIDTECPFCGAPVGSIECRVIGKLKVALDEDGNAILPKILRYNKHFEDNRSTGRYTEKTGPIFDLEFYQDTLSTGTLYCSRCDHEWTEIGHTNAIL